MGRETWDRARVEAIVATFPAHGWDLDRAAAAHGLSRNTLESALRRVLGRSFGDMQRAAASGAAVVVQASDSKPSQPAACFTKAPEPETAAPEVEWSGARPRVSGSGVERRLVVSDLHIPFHHKAALSCFYALCRVLQPHEIIILGDLINNGGFSRHDPPSPEPERYDLSILGARSFLRNVKRAAPGARKRIVLGNHDCWSDRWIAANPWAQGATFDLELQLGIRAAEDDDREPENADVMLYKRPEEEPLVLGPIAYAHGNGGGIHFAKRYAETLAPRAGVRHLRVGHHHTAQHYRAKNGCECWGVPWLGDERFPAFRYAPAPRGWMLGVLMDDVCGEHVTTTPIEIHNGAALVAGHLVAAA